MGEQVEEPEREQRIINEIIVDCYREHGQAMGWWCYPAT
jgi:hypothetical protein